MANRFLNNIKINDSYTLPPADGTANQIIQTNGAGELSFIDPSAISVGESEQVHIACKNTSGVAISKGDPVYITGTVGTSFIIEIAAADASNSAKMPAVGLAETDLGINAEGFVIVSGVLKNLTTDPLSTSDGTPSSNDTVYVKAGGGLTRTKPTGSGNLIQNVGKVGRVNSANAGSLAVSTIMRTNDVPNLTTGKIWVGSPTYTTESTVVHLDETNGRMGIGTTSPSYKLDVNGGAQFNTNTGTTPFYITRLGSATEALSIKVTDQHVRFESIQDEAADSYGGFDFRMDGGVTEPNFVIRKNADDPILHVDGAGKVGINSTNPLSTLQVGDGTADSSFRTYYSDSTYAEVRGYGVNFNRQYSYLRPTTDNYAFLYIGSQPNTWNELHLHSNKITFSDNTSEVMRINPGGNVGIGTTSPGQKLTIDQGVGNVNQGIPATSGSTQNGILRLQPGGPYGESFDFGMNVSTTYAWIQPTNKGNHSVNYNLSLNPNGGNVGIGTTSPSYTLDVSGSAGSTARFKGSGGQATVSINDGTNDNYIVAVSGEFQLRPSGTTVLTTKSSGNVGIGTTSPDSKLTINGGVNSVWAYSTTTSDQPGFIAADNADYASHTNLLYNKIYGSGITATSFGQTLGNWAVVASSGTSNNGLLVGTFSNKPVIIGTNSAARMTITNSGNVGIGTTSPVSIGGHSGILTLYGSNATALALKDSVSEGHLRFNDYNFKFTNTGGDVRMQIEADTGNVGIGTTSPAHKLTINASNNTTALGIDFPSAHFDFSANSTSGYTSNFRINDVGMDIGHDSTARSLNLQTGNQDRLTILGTGNVGIGTTSPNSNVEIKEDVNNGEGAELRVINDGTAVGTGQTTTITIGRNFEERNIKIKSVSSEDYGRKPELVITQNQNESGSSHVEVLRIDSSGNVGIGEDEPATKLDVSGNIRMTETAATSDTDKFVVLDSGVLKYRNGAEIRDDIDAIGGSGTGGTIALFTASGTDLGDSIITQSSQPDKITIGGQLSLQGSGDVLNISHYSGSVWFIDTSTGDDILFGAPATNTQNVGVQGDLYAYNGDLGTKSFGSFNNKISRTGNSYFNAGNVGIGTTSPSQKLTINGTDQYVATQHTSFPWDGSVTIGLKMGTDNAAGLLDFRRWTGSATLHGTALITQVSSDGGYGLDFRVDNKSTNTSATTSRMFLSTSGEVGIGTISPAAKLEVNGTSLLRGLVNITTSGEMLRLNDTNSSGNPYMSFYQNGTRRSFIQHADTGDFLKLASEYGGISFFTGTGGTETQKVTINSSGNVGIGTTSPSSKLTVVDDILLTGSSPSLTLTDATSSFVVKTNTAGEGILQTSGTSKPIRFFRNNGSNESMRINGNGNVGIGTISPARKLHVQGDNNDDPVVRIVRGNNTAQYLDIRGYQIQGRGNHLLLTADDTKEIWLGQESNSQRMVIDSAGRVGIGITSLISDSLLTLHQNDVDLEFSIDNAVADTARILSYDRTANTHRDLQLRGKKLTFYANSNERMRLEEDGDLHVDGDVIAYSTTISDSRLKDEVKTINNAVDKVKKLRGVEYVWNKGSKEGQKDLGVIAQEVEKVLPEIVKEKKIPLITENSNKLFKTVDYEKITAVLIEAIKEQQKQIDELKNQLDAFTK